MRFLQYRPGNKVHVYAEELSKLEGSPLARCSTAIGARFVEPLSFEVEDVCGFCTASLGREWVRTYQQQVKENRTSSEFRPDTVVSVGSRWAGVRRWFRGS